MDDHIRTMLAGDTITLRLDADDAWKEQLYIRQFQGWLVIFMNMTDGELIRYNLATVQEGIDSINEMTQHFGYSVTWDWDEEWDEEEECK